MSASRARPVLSHEGRLDPGPVFCAEPFSGIRAVRAITDGAGWRSLIDGLADGRLAAPSCHCQFEITGSSSTVLLGRDGTEPAHDVIAGACRPVLGVVASLRAPPMPPAEPDWQLAVPSYMQRGRDLADMTRERRVSGWPEALLGIDWFPGRGGDLTRG